MAWKFHQGGCDLERQCSGSPCSCNPDEPVLPGLPISWLPTAFSGSGTLGLTPVPWTRKNIWNFPILRPKRWSLLPLGPGWAINILNFYWVVCKSYSNGTKKWIELRVEYVEYIASLVAVDSFFLVGVRIYQYKLVEFKTHETQWLPPPRPDLKMFYVFIMFILKF